MPRKCDCAYRRRPTQSKRRFETVAWAASVASKRAPSERFTHGPCGSSILSAFANAVFLLEVTGAIGRESVQRPKEVAGVTVMMVGTIGIFVNGATALLFASGRKDDINIQGASLHMVNDAAVSAGVIILAAPILWTEWLWLDDAMSLAICAVILWSTWGLLRSSVDMSLSRTSEINLKAVRVYLLDRPGMMEVHDLRVSSLITTETAMTCHFVIPYGHPGDQFLMESAYLLRELYKIGHATLQIEITEGNACSLAPDSVV